MAMLLLLLVLGCFQFSNQDPINTKNSIKNEISLTEKDIPLSEMLDGADEEHWYKGGKEENVNIDEISMVNDNEMLDEADKDHWYKGDENDNGNSSWTEEDENWLDKLQAFFESSEESFDSDEIEQLIENIEKFIKENYPKYKNYKWFLNIIEYFDKDLDDYDYADYDKKEDTLDALYGKDKYYSWLLKQPTNQKSLQRFSSV